MRYIEVVERDRQYTISFNDDAAAEAWMDNFPFVKEQLTARMHDPMWTDCCDDDACDGCRPAPILRETNGD